MRKQLFTLFLLTAWLSCALSKSVPELQFDTDEELSEHLMTLNNQARRTSTTTTKREKVKAASTTTTTAPETTSTTTATQRPLIFQYWNNLVERVRLPFSNFTNPLVNLFNDGNTNNVIETPILEYNIENPPPKRRRKSGSKRKSAHSTRHRYQAYDLPVNDLDYEYDYDQQHQLPYYDQQTIVPAPPSRQVYYFYDPNTRRYYGLQAMEPNDYYTTQPQYQQHYTKLRKPQPAYYYTGDEYHPSYYQPISSHSHRRRRPTSQKHRPKPMRVTTPTTPTAEEPIEEVPTMYEEEQMELTQMPEMPAEMQNEQQMQEENYMPAEGVDVVENFDDEEDEFRQLQGTPEVIDTEKEEEPEVEETEAKEEAMLRNVLGSFMSDDSLNRHRQRSHAKETTKKAKQTPRYKYYVLGNW